MQGTVYYKDVNGNVQAKSIEFDVSVEQFCRDIMKYGFFNDVIGGANFIPPHKIELIKFLYIEVEQCQNQERVNQEANS